jgi:hypothetical protein
VRQIGVMRMGRLLAGDGAVGSGADVGSLAQAQYDGLTNIPVVAAFLSFLVAQSLKVLTTWYNPRIRYFFFFFFFFFCGSLIFCS